MQSVVTFTCLLQVGAIFTDVIKYSWNLSYNLLLHSLCFESKTSGFHTCTTG